MSRAYTTEEVEEQFLDHVRGLVSYWKELPDKELEDRLSGLAFSILVLLDGGTDLPHFLVIPSPHPLDQAYREENDDDYYSEASLENSISGSLHEIFYRR